MTSLAPDAHAKILATAATVPRASVLKVIPGKMLTILASVSNKQCDILEENCQALDFVYCADFIAFGAQTPTDFQHEVKQKPDGTLYVEWNVCCRRSER